MLLICVLFVNEPCTKAQSNLNVINIPLAFHPCSLILNEANGSFCLYEGVNGLEASGNNPTQINLIAQIYGQQTLFGMSIDYWSAIIIWAMRVPKDLHVYGAVNIKAYISSNFEISGFTSGSGYSMGLVDIDENNNTVKQFISEEAPYSIGGNIFTPTPQKYNIEINTDYVFKAGHAIGFAVGFGATAQGFTASVYFDSADKPSGATLPIVDTTESYDFTADSQTIKIQSNSAIADYNYDSTQKAIQFMAKLIDYTQGYLTITIPKTLMQPPFLVSSGSQQITPTLTETQTSYQISFTHTRSSNPIQITGNSINNPTPTPTPLETPEPTLSPNPTSAFTPTPTTTDNNPANGPTLTIPELLAIAIIAVSAATVISLIIYKKKRTDRKHAP